jgi:dUTP pyrophosphatase
MTIKFKKLNDLAKDPFYASEGASGFDICSVENVLIPPNERKLISTGLSIEIPEEYELQIRPRSGFAYKNGITVLNTPGTIDSDYRGEIKVLLINLGSVSFMVNVGDRIAQGVIMAVPTIKFAQVYTLSETERGAGGFGSTGK